jgi:cation diffusion facilitator family transporter
MAANSSSKLVLYAALVGNILVVLTKAIAAAWTGSSAMLSEAVHSLVDTGNEILLLYGMRRSVRQADQEHPLGYGRELYFWSFIVALMVFALGAGVSIYEGILHILFPKPISDPLVNYVVLGLAFLFEGVSWWVALRQFRALKGPLGYYDAFRRSKDPITFMVLIEDSAALIGILIAALGTFAATTLDAPVFDGIASIVIGLVLAGTASLLARESKSLLLGERADIKLSDSILRIAEEGSLGLKANGVLALHLAPDQILVALSLEFADDLRAPQIEDAVINIERKIRAAHPEVVTLFVKPQTAKAFKETIHLRFGDPPVGVVLR